MRKFSVLILLILFASAALFSAGQGESAASGPTSLRFATTWGEADSKGVYFIPMLEKFSAENEDIELEIETYGSDDMVTKITVELASGELPDIFSYWGGKQRLGPLVEGNALLNMDTYFAETDLAAKGDFTSAGIDHFTVNGVLQGIPMESNVAAFVCNKEMFDAYGLDFPETYEDMLAAGKVFRQNGIIPFANSSNGGNPSHFTFSELYKQFDGGLEEIKALPQTKQFATDNALKVARIIADMRENDLLPADTVSNGGWGPSFALYNEEKAAMIYTYPWMLGSMEQSVQDKSVVIDVPQMPDSDIDTSSFISGFATFGFVVNDKSYSGKKHDALKTLTDYMISDEMFTELMKGGLIPTKNYDMPFDAFNDIMQQTLKHYQGRPQTTSHFWNIDDPAVATALKGALDELYAGIISPEEMVSKVQTAFDNSDM